LKRKENKEEKEMNDPKIIDAILKSIKEQGGNERDLHHLLNDPYLTSKVAKDIIDLHGGIEVVCQILIDKNLPKEEETRIRKYYEQESSSEKFIMENQFPILKTPCKAELVKVYIEVFKRTIEDILNLLKSKGLHAACFEHLEHTFLGHIHGQLKCDIGCEPIYALGSKVVNSKGIHYPVCTFEKACIDGSYLYTVKDEDLHWSEVHANTYIGNNYFLAVRLKNEGDESEIFNPPPNPQE